MTQQQLKLQLSPRRPAGPGRVVMAGVVGACALGAGLGLWARPGPPAQADRPARAEPAQRPRALQIVLDDAAMPVARLLEVLPGDLAAVGDTTSARDAPPAPPPPAPSVPPVANGVLMKVEAPIVGPVAVPAVEEAPRPKAAAAKPKVAAEPVKDQAGPGKAKVAEAKPKNAERVATQEVASRADKPEKSKATATAPKAEKVARSATAKSAKLVKAEPKKLAKSEPKKIGKSAKAKPRDAILVKSVRAASKPIRAEARPVPRDKAVQLTQAKAKAKARPAQVKVAPKALAARKPSKVEKAAAPSGRAAAPKRIVVPRGAGPLRVARAPQGNPCVSGVPSVAVVCANRRFDARERQLEKAYRNAEAAGAPAALLQRQQARWLQARAAAAREAPWAVEDVYEARISELRDLSRGGREN